MWILCRAPLVSEFCCKRFVMDTMVLCWGLGRTRRFARLLSTAAPPGAYGSLGDTKIIKFMPRIYLKLIPETSVPKPEVFGPFRAGSIIIFTDPDTNPSIQAGK
jgi:hypothetical protein